MSLLLLLERYILGADATAVIVIRKRMRWGNL